MCDPTKTATSKMECVGVRRLNCFASAGASRRFGEGSSVRSCEAGWVAVLSGPSLHWLLLQWLLSPQNIVSKNAMQYRGNAQHDAQEFLLWLLDRVHEDLNNVVNSSGMPPLKVRGAAGDAVGVCLAHRLSL